MVSPRFTISYSNEIADHNSFTGAKSKNRARGNFEMKAGGELRGTTWTCSLANRVLEIGVPVGNLLRAIISDRRMTTYRHNRPTKLSNSFQQNFEHGTSFEDFDLNLQEQRWRLNGKQAKLLNVIGAVFSILEEYPGLGIQKETVESS